VRSPIQIQASRRNRAKSNGTGNQHNLALQPCTEPAPDAAPEPVSADFLGILPEKNNPTTQNPLKRKGVAPVEPEQPKPSLSIPTRMHPIHPAKKMIRKADAFSYAD